MEIRYDSAPMAYVAYRTYTDEIFIPFHLIRNGASFVKQKLSHSHNYAAVLMAGEDIILKRLITSSLAANMNNELYKEGIKTDWIFGATRGDLMDILEDEKYQTIVTVGHGDRSNWRAKDSVITQDEISIFYGNLPKKIGYWFQHSCGSSHGKPLGIDVMENPEERCLFYINYVNAYDMSWLGLPKHNILEEKIGKEF